MPVSSLGLEPTLREMLGLGFVPFDTSMWRSLVGGFQARLCQRFSYKQTKVWLLTRIQLFSLSMSPRPSSDAFAISYHLSARFS